MLFSPLNWTRLGMRSVCVCGSPLRMDALAFESLGSSHLDSVAELQRRISLSDVAAAIDFRTGFGTFQTLAFAH
jgi:hypothetical protein